MDYANAAADDLVMEFNTNGLQTGTLMNSARARVSRMAASDPAAPNKARASGDFKVGLIAAIPKLRAFAILLSGNRDRADDLVQETLAKALQNFGSFEIGSNFIAWLQTILRNAYYTEFRKRWREVSDADGEYAGAIGAKPEQEIHLEYLEFVDALQQLPPTQRELLVLVGASGFSYEEAAEISGCEIGTVKSRVSRGRQRLCALLRGEQANSGEMGKPARLTHLAAVAGSGKKTEVHPAPR